MKMLDIFIVEELKFSRVFKIHHKLCVKHLNLRTKSSSD